MSATALLSTGDSYAFCELASKYGPVSYGGGGAGGGSDYTNAAETTIVTVPAGTVLAEACYGETAGDSVYNASITAIRVSASSVGTRPTLLPHHIVPGLPKASPGVIGPPRS